ncbi:Pr6Pr family membrane protein [Streptococcus sp. 20-1249]|uniref:Pr6Pr family membrane protein n=1 Tax=Streptococcus hepaticus TaxID=3349163 RepID=UPI00374912A4
MVYHIFLAPLVSARDYWNIENFLVHYIVPIGFVADTLWNDRRAVYAIRYPFWWLLPQFAYSFLALFNGFVTKIPIPGSLDSPFAYFFLNIPKYGWGFVLSSSVLLFVSYLFMGYIFLFLKKWIGRPS